MPLVPDAQAQLIMKSDVLILDGTVYLVRDVKEERGKISVLLTNRPSSGNDVRMHLEPSHSVELWRVRV